MAELELHGVDAARSILGAVSSDGVSGTSRSTLIRFGNANVTRGEIEDWLKWKSSREALWVRVGAIAAVLAAVFAFLALLKFN
ncbi:MAG: hypothetical protein KJS68_01445 [Alphaproteobacteria bacterium]|nr:hypothetical protein [Alphaproteobacteria bacterium]